VDVAVAVAVGCTSMPKQEHAELKYELATAEACDEYAAAWEDAAAA